MKLYVGNLSFQTGEADLNDLFSAHGTVDSCRIITDRDTGRSRGFGFVEMSSKAEGEAAMSALSGKEVEGRALTVNEAKPQEPRNGGGNRGGRDRKPGFSSRW
jgi:RNA recognition motif-containing protein